MKNAACIRLTPRVAAWAVLAALCVTGAAAAQSLNLPTESIFGSRPRAGDPDYLAIGPGKVQLSFTRGGSLLDLTPAWTAGRSLIGGGGFIVFATGPDGELMELVNSSLNDLTVREETRGIPVCHEGMAGGFRAPSLDPDDDGDGWADEDRLDGVDNDGDGKTDEDFAAVGDEMVVTEFVSDVTPLGARLVFHQECYAWSLPNIEGAVMISIEVRNEGQEALYGVRMGTLLRVRGPFSFSEPTMTARMGRGVSSSVPCWVSTTSDGGSVVLVALGENEPDKSWLGGYVPATENFGASVRETAAARERAPGARPGSTPGLAARGDGRIDADANVYALSPAIEVLRPGQDTRVDFALVAVPRGAAIDEATINASRTYRGDGAHTYLPPPVSMTPRVLWGYYRAAEGDEPGLAIELEGVGSNPVSPEDLSYFSSVDESQVERRETYGGKRMIVIHGAAAERALQRGERLTLKGRLRSGEFFEAILRPTAPQLSSRVRSDAEAQRFWKSDGRLSRELLNGSPNPFRDATTIFYEIPSVIETDDGGHIRSKGVFETSVKVYDVTGRLVTVLVDREELPGVHSVRWNAVDDSGNPVASGVYYIKLQIERRFITRRLTLLK